MMRHDEICTSFVQTSLKNLIHRNSHQKKIRIPATHLPFSIMDLVDLGQQFGLPNHVLDVFRDKAVVSISTLVKTFEDDEQFCDFVASEVQKRQGICSKRLRLALKMVYLEAVQKHGLKFCGRWWRFDSFVFWYIVLVWIHLICEIWYRWINMFATLFLAPRKGKLKGLKPKMSSSPVSSSAPSAASDNGEDEASPEEDEEEEPPPPPPPDGPAWRPWEHAESPRSHRPSIEWSAWTKNLLVWGTGNGWNAGGRVGTIFESGFIIVDGFWVLIKRIHGDCLCKKLWGDAGDHLFVCDTHENLDRFRTAHVFGIGYKLWLKLWLKN